MLALPQRGRTILIGKREPQDRGGGDLWTAYDHILDA